MHSKLTRAISISVNNYIRTISSDVIQASLLLTFNTFSARCFIQTKSLQALTYFSSNGIFFIETSYLICTLNTRTSFYINWVQICGLQFAICNRVLAISEWPVTLFLKIANICKFIQQF